MAVSPVYTLGLLEQVTVNKAFIHFCNVICFQSHHDISCIFLTLRHSEFSNTNISRISPKNSHIFRRTRKSTSKITPKNQFDTTRDVISYVLYAIHLLMHHNQLDQSYYHHTSQVTYPFSTIRYSNVYWYQFDRFNILFREIPSHRVSKFIDIQFLKLFCIKVFLKFGK